MLKLKPLWSLVESCDEADLHEERVELADQADADETFCAEAEVVALAER